MALLHMSLPPVIEISYISIFPVHLSSGPHYEPLFGGPWLNPVTFLQTQARQTYSMLITLKDYREPVHVAMAYIAHPQFGKPTGMRQYTGARPTDPLSHGGPGLHYI